MSEDEIKLLKDKLDFVTGEADGFREAFFKQKDKIRELYKEIAKYEAKENKDIEKVIKKTKFETEKITVEMLCDIFDDSIGLYAYEITDRIRKTYKLPTKYGY